MSLPFFCTCFSTRKFFCIIFGKKEGPETLNTDRKVASTHPAENSRSDDLGNRAKLLLEINNAVVSNLDLPELIDSISVCLKACGLLHRDEGPYEQLRNQRILKAAYDSLVTRKATALPDKLTD